MKANQRALSIGQAAGLLGVPTSVLRHWEDEGLLCPERDASGYRRYTRDDVVRLAFIHHNRRVGVPLEQIRTLLSRDAQGRREVLEAHVEDLDRQAREIDEARRLAAHTLGCSAPDVESCPTFGRFADDLVAGDVDIDGLQGYFPPHTGPEST